MSKAAGKQTIKSIFNKGKALPNKKGVDQHLMKTAEKEFDELVQHANSLQKSNPLKHRSIKDAVDRMEVIKIRSMPSHELNGVGHLHKFLDSQASLDNGIWKTFALLIECRKHMYAKESPVNSVHKSGVNHGKQRTPSNHTGMHSPTVTKQASQRVSSFPSPNKTPTNSNPRQTTMSSVLKQSPSPGNAFHKGTRQQTSAHDHNIVNGQTSPSQPKFDADYDRVLKENMLLKKAISEQNQQIEDLTTRLSKYASHQLTKGNPNIADLSDKNRPTKIGEKFSLVYDDQWSEAFEALRASGKKDESVVAELAMLVEECYSFCEEAKHKMTYELQRTVKDPFHPSISSEVQKDIPLQGWDNIFHDILKAHGEQSVKSLQLAFRRQRQKESHSLDKRILEYMDCLVELTWYMIIQDPPMVLRFIKNGEKMDEKVFKPYSKTGNIALVCVWPALTLHNGGPIVSKGYALPM